MKVAIFYNAVNSDANQDELDVLVQVEAVSDALVQLGHQPEIVTLGLNLELAISALRKMKPDIVFNLVESIGGFGRFIHFAPTILEALKIPYTGGHSNALFVTTNKILTKELLHRAGVATPAWLTLKQLATQGISFDPPYIIKPIAEDASVGIDEDALVNQRVQLTAILKERSARFGECFAEAYIPGREFNLSIVAGPQGPEVLPPAEMLFTDFPQNKPRIVGYRAKWDEESFEYRATNRTFDLPATDTPLLNRLNQVTQQCWELFKLRGYARVDFRVSETGTVLVLEVNVNPCISPDSGFVAACRRAGLTFPEVVQRILQDSLS
jgi:D-alanine-D-alanine ligase